MIMMVAFLRSPEACMITTDAFLGSLAACISMPFGCSLSGAKHRLAWGAFFFYKKCRMSTTPQFPAPAPVPPTWKPDVIFAMIADPVRRRLLLRLAGGPPLSATQLSAGAGRRPDAVLKHLSALRDARLLVASPDPRDGRRMLYALAPDVPVAKTERGTELDFGCCVLRV